MDTQRALENRIENCDHILAKLSFKQEIWVITDSGARIADINPVYNCNTCNDFVVDTEEVYTLYDRVKGLYINTNL